jgi:hypothetical protein
MSFKIFIYYCACLGGWAAFLVWGVNQVSAIQAIASSLVKTSVIGALLGLVLAATVGGLDAILNASGQERLERIGVCALIGLVGGLVGGFLGQLLANRVEHLIVVAWALVGMAIGASIGVYDILAREAGSESRMPLKKITNGILGGLIGGLIGGFFNGIVGETLTGLSRTSKAMAFVILGASIGLFIGLAQVFLKDAWLKVEAGFRAGREMMLTKDETTIGRSESCDLGLFGDNTIERLHSRIRLQNNHYQVEDNGSTTGTFLNDQRITQAMPLRNGDVIRIGNSVVRFGERANKNETESAS